MNRKRFLSLLAGLPFIGLTSKSKASTGVISTQLSPDEFNRMFPHVSKSSPVRYDMSDDPKKTVYLLMNQDPRFLDFLNCGSYEIVYIGLSGYLFLKDAAAFIHIPGLSNSEVLKKVETTKSGYVVATVDLKFGQEREPACGNFGYGLGRFFSHYEGEYKLPINRIIKWLPVDAMNPDWDGISGFDDDFGEAARARFKADTFFNAKI